MAIDTRSKRQSVAAVGRWFRPPAVTPDATPDQAWRQTAGHSYNGILAAEPATDVGVTLHVYGGTGDALELRGGTSVRLHLRGGTADSLEVK